MIFAKRLREAIRDAHTSLDAAEGKIRSQEAALVHYRTNEAALYAESAACKRTLISHAHQLQEFTNTFAKLAAERDAALARLAVADQLGQDNETALRNHAALVIQVCDRQDALNIAVNERDAALLAYHNSEHEGDHARDVLAKLLKGIEAHIRDAKVPG